MKRIGVAALITRRDNELLMGRRAKEPNQGLLVFPGGGVEEGETLEQALSREVQEETGYRLLPDPNRWNKPVHVVELEDRIIIFVEGMVADPHSEPVAGSDLTDVQWVWQLPGDISPVVAPIWFAHRRLRDQARMASHYDPYAIKSPSAW